MLTSYVKFMPSWLVKMAAHEIALPLMLFGAIILLIRERKHSHDPETAPPIASLPPIHIENKPYFENKPSNIQNNSTSIAAAKPVQEKPKPRLVWNNARIRPVSYDISYVWQEGVSMVPVMEGVLIDVFNQPAGEIGEDVGTADNLAVSIDAIEDGNEHPGIVSRVYWLEREGHRARLHSGERATALLAVREKDFDFLSLYNNPKAVAPIYLGAKRLPRSRRLLEPVRAVRIGSGVTLKLKLLDIDKGRTLQTHSLGVFADAKGFLYLEDYAD